MYWPEYGDSMTVGPYTVHNKTTVNETTSCNLTELNLVLCKEEQLIYQNQVFPVMLLFQDDINPCHIHMVNSLSYSIQDIFCYLCISSVQI